MTDGMPFGPAELAHLQRLYRLIFGHPITQIVTTAVRLGVPDALGDTAIPVDELAGTIGTDPAALRRLLAALADLELVADEPAGVRLTGLGKFLRSDVPGSVHAAAELAGHPAMWRAWGSLEETVRTGQPGFEREFGRPFFEHLDTDPELAGLFNRVLSGRTRFVLPQIVRAYDFANCGKIIDVGGGDGTMLAAILRANPATTGVIFDSAATVDQAQRNPLNADVLDRLDTKAGDFFDAVPAGGDTYLLKNILHDWSDEQCRAILRGCRAAMAPASTLLLVTMLRAEQDGPRDMGAAISDVEMMVLTPGRERTLAEYRELLESSGFTVGAVHATGQPPEYSVIEATPA